jgi:hypothetical protein
MMMKPPRLESCSHFKGQDTRGIIAFRSFLVDEPEMIVALCARCVRATAVALSRIEGLQYIFLPTTPFDAPRFPAREIKQDGEYAFLTINANGAIAYVEVVEVRDQIAYVGSVHKIAIAEIADNIQAQGPL